MRRILAQDPFEIRVEKHIRPKLGALTMAELENAEQEIVSLISKKMEERSVKTQRPYLPQTINHILKLIK